MLNANIRIRIREEHRKAVIEEIEFNKSLTSNVDIFIVIRNQWTED